MGKLEVISPDGSWKVEVEAWSTSLILYSAIGVTTRVYLRGSRNWWQKLWNLPAGWDPTTADVISASGSMASSQFPIASAPLPGSPNYRQNDSVADCRAWTVGGVIKFQIARPEGGPVNLQLSGGGGASSLNIIADMIRGGNGTATRNGVTIAVGPVNYP